MWAIAIVVSTLLVANECRAQNIVILNNNDVYTPFVKNFRIKLMGCARVILWQKHDALAKQMSGSRFSFVISVLARHCASVFAVLKEKGNSSYPCIAVYFFNFFFYIPYKWTLKMIAVCLQLSLYTCLCVFFNFFNLDYFFHIPYKWTQKSDCYLFVRCQEVL